MSNSAQSIMSPQANFSPQYLPWYTRTAACSVNSNEGVLVNSATGSFTATLPASPSVGDRVAFVDIGGYCGTSPVTVGRNSNNIQGIADDLSMDIAGSAFELLWTGATRGWTLKEFPSGAGATGYTSLVTLTDASTIALDLSRGNDYTVTLGGARTLGNFTNGTPGQSGVIIIKQDGTGGRTLACGSYYKFSGAVVPALSTAISAVDVWAYAVESSTVCHVVMASKGSA